MDETDAKAALRAMGIIAPSRSLVENWLKAARAAQELEQETPAERSRIAPSPPGTQEAGSENTQILAPTPKPTCLGKSLLEPILCDQGTLEKPQAKRHKSGRPRIIASWFPAVAETMADGTTLRTALAINRLTLSSAEVRALYRNRTFKALYQEARRRYLLENWGRSKRPSLRSVLASFV